MESEEIYRGEAGEDYEGFACHLCGSQVESDEIAVVVVVYDSERVYHEDCYGE